MLDFRVVKASLLEDVHKLDDYEFNWVVGKAESARIENIAAILKDVRRKDKAESGEGVAFINRKRLSDKDLIAIENSMVAVLIYEHATEDSESCKAMMNRIAGFYGKSSIEMKAYNPRILYVVIYRENTAFDELQ